MTQLAQALDGRISAVAGPSGVGKSSIINALRLRTQQQQQHQSQHAQHTDEAQQADHAQQASHAQQEQQQADYVLMAHDRQDSGAQASSSFVSRHESLDTHQPPLPQSIEATEAMHRQTNDVSSDPNLEEQNHTRSGSASSDANHQDTIAKSVVSVHQDSQKAVMPSQSKHSHLEEAPQSLNRKLDSQHQQEDTGAVTASQALSQQSSNHTELLGHQQDGLSADSASLLGHETSAPRPSSSTPSDEASSSGRQEEEGWAKQRGSDGAGEGVQLQSVGAMSNIGRGMHTTRHVALLKVLCSHASHCIIVLADW